MEQELKMQESARNIERKLGIRVFGDCPVCGDYITKSGECYYCLWNNKCTAEETCEMYNQHWAAGHVKPGYEREPKTPEDFK